MIVGFKSCPRVGGISIWAKIFRQKLEFQVVPPCGGHLPSRNLPDGRLRFKSCPRVGGIAAHRFPKMLCRSFKSCPRVGGILAFVFVIRRCSLVSSRAPVWGASRGSLRRSTGCRFQVVPPCGGHHLPAPCVPLLGHVSSRAPVWGASFYAGKIYHRCHVSSRAPVWGASLQPTPTASGPQVSSRAPVWGASNDSGHNFFHFKFQVVPPCGGHLKVCKHMRHLLCRFQVVPPCGGHPMSWVDKIIAVQFQVVPPCGGHLKTPLSLAEVQIVSSRAPVWGASVWRTRASCPRIRFKSCPRVGGIICVAMSGMAICPFQVVPPCGGHPGQEAKLRGLEVSSRAPVWGASPPLGQIAKSFSVSSRAPVWGASRSTTGRLSQAAFQVVPPCGGHPPLGIKSVFRPGFKSCPRVGGIYC